MATKTEKLRALSNTQLLEKAKESIAVPSVCSFAEGLYRRVVVEMPDDCILQLAQYQQLLKCLNSVSACIMEGIGYSDTQQHIRFLKMARGSALESSSHARCLGRWEPECLALVEMVNSYVIDILDDYVEQ